MMHEIEYYCTSVHSRSGYCVLNLKFSMKVFKHRKYCRLFYQLRYLVWVDNMKEGIWSLSTRSYGKYCSLLENSPLMESIGIQVCLPHEKVSEKVGVDEITVKIDSRPSSEGESSSYLAVPRDKAKSWSSLPSTSPAAEESARTDKSNQAEFYDEDGAGIAKDNTTRWKVMLKGGKRKKSLRVKFKDVRRSLASLSPPNLDCSSEGESTGSENSPRHSIYHTCSTKSMEKLESDESTGPWYS